LFGNKSLRVGFSFGLTSGIITTLGLIMGVYSVNPSKYIVIGAILTIAIADAFSDALGMHISQESEKEHSVKEIWISTASTFFAKLIFASTFIIPFLIFTINISVIISMIWGLLLLGIFSYIIAKDQKISPLNAIAEHMFIAIIVLIMTRYAGNWIGEYFGNIK